MEDLGNTLGATVVAAMMRDAIENSAVLSTDATGAAIQPEPGPKGQKQVCKKGHFFNVVADADHVLYAYAERHTRDAVAKLFHGFRGFLQSEASSVHDILERGPPREGEVEVRPTLVGCCAHARRYFFEAAICKYAVGVEGLTHIRAIYAADKPLADLPPSERRRRRSGTSSSRPRVLEGDESEARRQVAPGSVGDRGSAATFGARGRVATRRSRAVVTTGDQGRKMRVSLGRPASPCTHFDCRVRGGAFARRDPIPFLRRTTGGAAQG